MLRRDKRRNSESTESADSPTAATSARRYRMVEKLATFGDDFFIEDQDGNKAFKVDGKALRARDTLVFEDPHGKKLYEVQTRIARVRDSMEIENASGKRAAVVHKAVIDPVRDRFSVSINDGPDMDVQGNILDHEYRIKGVAEVSRKWFRVRDSYGVEVEPGQDPALVLAITTCLDQMTLAEAANK